MSGHKLLFDSNIIIYLSKGELQLRSFTHENDLPCLSVISYMEIMGYSFKNKKEQIFIEHFCSASNIIHLENTIVEKGIELRKKYRIKLPDAIIAATALVNDITLVTRNSNDFKSIPDLQISNPFEDLDEPADLSK